MTAIPLLDALATANQSTKAMNRLATLASRMVEDLLEERGRIRRIEADFGTDDWSDLGGAIEIEGSIHSMYRQWASEAEQVLLRVRRLSEAGVVVDRTDVLEDAYASTLSRLQLTPEKTSRGIQQANTGAFTPAEELRTELRARIRT